MRIERGKGQVIKLVAALVAVVATMALVPAVANGASRAPEKVSPEVTRPVVARPALVSPAWRFEIVRGLGWRFELAESPEWVVAPAHRPQLETARLLLGGHVHPVDR